MREKAGKNAEIRHRSVHGEKAGGQASCEFLAEYGEPLPPDGKTQVLPEKSPDAPQNVGVSDKMDGSLQKTGREFLSERAAAEDGYALGLHESKSEYAEALHENKQETTPASSYTDSCKPQKNVSVQDSYKPQKSVQAQSSYEPQQNMQAQGSQIAEMPNYTARQVPAEKPQQLNFFEEKLLEPQAKAEHKIIGQVFDTYWLVEFHDNLYIIDQHAAHEKVNYERFVKRFKEQSIESQYLNPPLVVTLNMDEQAKLKANEEYFRKYGFEIEPFGGREYCISAVPTNLYGFHEEELFLEMLDNLASEKDKDPLGIFASRLATMACKAAVKGNHQMSDREANALIDELLTLENPYHCPHGRPTIISMTKTELEKKFKRIV